MLDRILLPALACALAACSAPGSSGGTTSGSSSGSGGGTGSGSGSGGVATSSGPVALPFVVSDQFVPSGFMGDAPADFNAIKMASDAAKCPARQPDAKGACYSIAWTPTILAGAKTAWVGVYWQYPSNNWGAKDGKVIAPGATKVTFSAAGAKGGEPVTFLVGGVNTSGGNPTLTHADTFTEKTETTLTSTWAKYEVPLHGDTYSSVIGGFAWSITTNATDPITFYVDDIQWE